MRATTSSRSVSLEPDAKLLDELLALLSREQAHLVKADVEAIEAILDEKSILLQRLNLAARARYDALAANGYEANEAGMDAWVQRNAKQNISQSWGKFQKALGQAKEMNRLNGVLISKHFNRNQELLNHLQGNTSKDSVYGRDGQAKSQAPARSGLIV
jgi:flagellar biosynthesis protein FlgN